MTPQDKRESFVLAERASTTIGRVLSGCTSGRANVMSRAMLFIALLLLSPVVLAQESQKPLAPAEAAKKADQQVTVEFEVRSTGGGRNRYLNSASDFSRPGNFTIFIPQAALAKFAEAKIE